MRRTTMQKKILSKEIRGLSSFFNAYELSARIVKKNKRIGLATIYRFLNTLEKDGSIHSFLCGSKKIYSNNKKSHAHFKCERCGKIKHVTIRNIDFLLGTLGYEISHFQ